MTDELYYPNAPLTEAIIDIRVQIPEGLQPEILSTIQLGQEELYPKREDRVFLEGQISVDLSVPAFSGTRTHLGYVFTSSDGLQIFQARLDGFTFSRLKPYQHWDAFQGEARRLWNLYRNIVQPEAVTRLAVRYINKLDIPLPMRDLKDYLRTSPEVSSDLPQELSGYFMQLRIPQPNSPFMLALNQNLLEVESETVASVLLDIDLFQAYDVPQDEQAIWSTFDDLRRRKNHIFQSCVTEKMKKVILSWQQ